MGWPQRLKAHSVARLKLGNFYGWVELSSKFAFGGRSSREEMRILKWLRGGHEPRQMKVIDAVRVDGRRSVILVRRDNIEHLLMVGGPNDLVIEANIMRQPGRKPSQPSTSRLQEPPHVSTATAQPVGPPRETIPTLTELIRRLESELLGSPPLRGRPPSPDSKRTH